jgi:hypothetical protein
MGFSDESTYYKKGRDQGQAGKSSARGPGAGLNPTRNKKDDAAERRGHEAGLRDKNRSKKR